MVKQIIYHWIWVDIDQAPSKLNRKTYIRTLFRTSSREGGKVRHKTIANLLKCSQKEIEALKLAFKHIRETALNSLKESIKIIKFKSIYPDIL